MTTQTEALKMALEAADELELMLKSGYEHGCEGPPRVHRLIAKIRTLSAQQSNEQVEPVAWMIVHKSTNERFLSTQPDNWDDMCWFSHPLYTTPPQRKPHPDCDSGCMYVCTEGGQRLPKCEQRKPLTDEQIFVIKHNWITTPFVNHLDFARAIEAAHGIKE